MMKPMCMIGVLAVFVAVSGLQAQDDDKDKPAQEKKLSPADQFREVTNEFNKAQQEYLRLVRTAKTNEDRQEAIKKAPKLDDYTARAMKIVADNPKEPVAADALIWVVRIGPYSADARKAADLLLADHADDSRLATILPSMTFTPNGEKLIRGLLAKTTNRDTKGIATYALAQTLSNQSAMASRSGDEARAAKLSEEANGLFEQVLNDFGSLKLGNITLTDAVIQVLGRSGNSDEVLRNLLKKDLPREVKGKATYALAQTLKSQSDKAAATDEQLALKLSKEAESLFESVIADFADVPGTRGTLGDLAKPDLFELRFLSIGKTAPEIEAEDLDGETFKLSDYRGKVVMLDFWGQW